MSDKSLKAKKDVKLSIRVPREIVDFLLRKEGEFKNRSDFVNQALVYFVHHLEVLQSFEGRVQRKRPSSMTETRLHQKLKHLGWSLLFGEGCTSIEYEKPIILEGQRMIVDVYGIGRNKEEIAVECWVSHKNDETKFKLIQKRFSRLIVLTPDDLIEHYEDLLEQYRSTLNNFSSRFKLPIIREKKMPETTVQFINGNQLVGGELLPFDAIKKELLRGNMALIKGLEAKTVWKLRGKLRDALANEVKGKFKIFEKYVVTSKGEAGHILELRRYSK